MLLPLDKVFPHRGQHVAWGCIGTGDPVVMVHGFPWSAQSWRRIAPWLARNNKKVYYFDMIGFGESEMKSDQDVSPSVQNDLLAALFKHWDLDRPEVVAHDYGGLAVLRGHFVNQLQYSKLTLMNVVAVLPSGSPGYRYFRQHEQALAGLPSYAHEALVRSFIKETTYVELSQDVADMYARPWLDAAGQASFYRQIAHSSDQYIEDVQSLYGPMEAKINLVWAEEDMFIPINQGRELAGLLAADRFIAVAGASHLIQEDAPEAIVAALLSD